MCFRNSLDNVRVLLGVVLHCLCQRHSATSDETSTKLFASLDLVKNLKDKKLLLYHTIVSNLPNQKNASMPLITNPYLILEEVLSVLQRPPSFALEAIEFGQRQRRPSRECGDDRRRDVHRSESAVRPSSLDDVLPRGEAVNVDVDGTLREGLEDQRCRL